MEFETHNGNVVYGKKLFLERVLHFRRQTYLFLRSFSIDRKTKSG